MKEPTISLIIPAYNEEKYIGDCLRCAIENSGGRFSEIIVVDNGSVDKTSEIAKSFKEVKVFLESRKGVMWARQRGFMESSGDLCAYVDADTKIQKGWYEKIIKEFTSDEKLVCLSGRTTYYDVTPWQDFCTVLFWAISMPIYYIVGYMAIHCNLVIKRDTLVKMGGLNTSIAFYGDDTDTSRRAHMFGKSKFRFNFTMPTSGRRLAKQGIFKSGVIYALNFFSEVFIHKPVTKGYQDIR